MALTVALLLNYKAALWADAAGRNASPSPDLLFTILPLVDTRLVFVWGFAAFLAWTVVVTVWREREQAAYIAWLYAILIAIRSCFIILTPMRVPDEAVNLQDDWAYQVLGRYFTLRNDLFFSSHAALPFLGYLIFRDRLAKGVFLAFSAVLALAVLLARLHYSIDVAAAYFITYAIYRAEIHWLPAPGVSGTRRRVAPG